MTKTSSAGLRVGLGFFALASISHAADFHPISSITSSTSGTDLYQVNNLIQGPGSGFSASEPHGSFGGGSTHTWVTNAPNGGSGDYFSNGVPDPVLVIDLGADRSLSEISTWGYANSNTNGGRDFTLRFATSAEGTGSFGSSITYQPSFDAGFSADTRDSHSFSQTVTARFVEVTFTDNWRGLQGGTPGGDRVGLGEIAFEDSVPPIDPLLQIESSLNLDLDGSVQTIDIPVANLGATQTLTLSSPTFSGTNQSAFTLLSFPASIAPGGSGTIQISFNPTGLTGAISASMNVTTNDPSQGSVSVALSGFIHDPRISAPTFFNLGNFDSGSGIQTGQFTIFNLGGGQSLSLTNLEITGSNAGNFSITASPTSISPLGNDSVTVQLDPMGADGIFSAQLRITSNDALNPVTTINLNALVGDAIPNSGVRINEFVAGNNSSLDDGDGRSSDWIELYNAGPGSADLSGWYLTDRSDDLNQWEFPQGTTLAENAYLIVFASGQNVDDYVDAGGFLHTNFKLSTGGEYLGLIMPDGTTIKSEFAPTYPQQFSDVSFGTYSDGGSSANLIADSNAEVLLPTNGTLGLTWTFPSFIIDGSWLSPELGTGVGYDTGTDYDTLIDVDLQTSMYQSNPSAYIRIPFSVDEASSVATLSLRMHYDDGYYVYLNGQEIASRNAPANPTYNSTATTNANESDNIDIVDVSSFLPHLVNGENVLAIHGLNRSSSSSDFLAVPELNASFASTGPLLAGYLNTTTPGGANTGGSSNPGPEIISTNHVPLQPTESENIVVTANIQPRLVAIGDVELSYRVQYGSTTVITMKDDGTGDDAVAGDFLYTATIPASAYGPEDMVRWFINARDTAGNATRLPAFLDQTGTNQSAEYFGTVTLDPSVTSDMPIFQWFTQNVSGSHTRSGARASVFFKGRFYDNIFVRQRGGATNGSVSQKFDFNKGDSFFAIDEMSSIGEINMNGNGADSTYIRQQMGFDTHRLAGNESCLTELWQMRANGGSDRVGVAIEQVDEDFMERYGYDRDGDLYKFVQRSNLNPVFFDTITGIEKKTGDETNIDSVVDLVAGLNLPTSDERRQWVIDNLDLPQITNYLAARSIIQDADDLRKNFYMYFDARGDERWRMLPWDKDFTFGVRGDGGTFLPHPFFGDEEHKKQNANQWNILYDVLFEEPVTQRIYLRRLRTLMDEVLQPSSTPSNLRILEQLASDIITPASPPLSSNINSVNSYLNSRRSVLFNNYPSLIPGSQPSSPGIAIAEVEANPTSGNQDQEFIRISNSENTEIDISGWTLEGGVDFTFRAGTIIERNGDLYVTPNSKDFLARSTSPKANEEHLTASPYSGHLSNFSETLILKDETGFTVDTFITPNNPSDAQLYLVISEIMYHPAAPNGSAEFIELMNISDSVTLDLTGVQFTAGIDFTFAAGTMLAPGERILIVLDQVVFESLYGPGLRIAGTFQNGSRLNNGSDRIKLEDATNSSILEFTYDDEAPWPTSADGQGFSLVLVDPSTSPDPDDPSSWMASSLPTGNPGFDNPVFSNPVVLAPLTDSVRVTVTLQNSPSLDNLLEYSTNLTSWDPATDIGTIMSVSEQGDGTAILVYETSPGFNSAFPELFFRLRTGITTP
ncbi:MAG: lamin tail domain-containing protein [Akkermansiaceae bacterium]